MTDTYFVVAHFHYIIFGAAVFPIFGGIYFWFPKVTGRRYFERPGQVSFWIIFVGTNLLFFPMHIVGLLGMPRRVYTYPSGLGWSAYNLAETIGGFVTLAGILVLLGNLVVELPARAARRPRPVARADARVGDELAAADVQLRGDPDGHERVPELGRGRPRRRPANLAAGVLVLDEGHEQVETSPADAELVEVVDAAARVAVAGRARGRARARASPCCSCSDLVAAALAVVACLLALVGWHATEPADARTAPAAGRRARRRPWWGMLVVIASEATLFGALLGTYSYLRLNTPSWPPDGIPRPRSPARSRGGRARGDELAAAARVAAATAARRRRGRARSSAGPSSSSAPTSPTRRTTSSASSGASIRDATRTARSTTRCSPPTTPRRDRRRARRVAARAARARRHDLPRRRGGRDRLVLALRQRR